MKLKLNRIYKAETYTIGKLYVDGVYFCDTLEDKVREDGVKVFGETAIPKGTYNVLITYSNRFKRDMPLLQNVPMFDGIRIHAGNTDKDTHGCILVGKNTIKGKVTASSMTYERLFEMLKQQKTITIEIS